MRSGILLAVVLGGTSVVVADTIHVPGDFLTIQEAIDAAVDGDEVEVHPGTYNEAINFLGKAIRVYSTDGPDVTIIDAQQTGTVVTCDSAEGPDSVLEGFSITGGNANAGGGMRIINSSPTVTNCTFSGNTASDEFGAGGGMFIDLGSSVISDCTFAANTAEYRGGGIYLRDGSMTVTNCTFEGNSTPVILQNGGGAIFSRDSPVNLVDCDFHENEGYHGGAINFVQFFGEGASLTLIGCSVTNNSADVGGGVFIQDAAALLINSTLIANQVSGEAGVGGGILLLSGSLAVLTNTTISANSAIEGGGMWIGGSNALVRNSILWDNSPDQILGSGIVTYSDVQGGYAGTGNIDADPLFVDPDNGDYHLSPGSPCIDAAANFYLPKGIDTDLDGFNRFVDTRCTDDTGNGKPPIVDMGAYEFQLFQVTCPWDIDCNGSVGAGDLLNVLTAWGPCPPEEFCPADFDSTGEVGASDLLALLANWGPCR